MGFLKAFFLVFLIALSFSLPEWARSESVPFPPLVSSLDVEGPLCLCGEGVPIENQDIRERLEKELLLSLWNRAQVILWLKRAPRYLPAIEKILKRHGMPDDLKYVAVAESALRPHAGSSKGAIGFWQFMRYTGRKYGLVINRRIDERRNLLASTRAAVRYFKALHETLNSWTLAIAAFNMGEEGLMAEILEQETHDYYNLYLPLETQRFIFRIIAVKLIFSNPQKYGFVLNEEGTYPPLSCDTIRLTCPGEVPISIVARAAGTHFKMIKDLNPQIRGHYLAKGTYSLLLPEGSSARFQARFQRLFKQFLASEKERIYVVKKGDSLSSIAERFDIPLGALLIWNRLDPSRPIHPGDRLIVYPRGTKPHR